MQHVISDNGPVCAQLVISVIVLGAEKGLPKKGFGDPSLQEYRMRAKLGIYFKNVGSGGLVFPGITQQL